MKNTNENRTLRDSWEHYALLRLILQAIVSGQLYQTVATKRLARHV